MNTHVRERENSARRTFVEVTPELRRLLEAIAEAAIEALDQIDGDADLEDGGDYEDEDGGDADGDEREPSLGWITTERWHLVGGVLDLEEECEDEGHDSDTEPTDEDDDTREPRQWSPGRCWEAANDA